MTLANKRTHFGFKASLMAPVLAVGLLAAAPASAAGLGGVATLGDISTDATSNIIQVAGRNGRVGRRGRGGRAGRRGYNNYAVQRRKSRRRKRRNAAIGIGIGILGAAILANRHYDRRRYDHEPVYAHRGNGYRAAKRKCARVYGEDYVWRTDLVYDHYGDARVCKFVKRLGY